MATMYENPSGTSMRPSTPLRKKTGMKTTMMTKLAPTMLGPISAPASDTTAEECLCSGSGRDAFSRSRRNVFSTPITASSTRAPIAIAIPPSVIVLMEIPVSLNAKIAVAKESGIARTEMSVLRPLHRKRKRISTTRMAPSLSAPRTFSIATSMKLACRKIPRLISRPGGSSLSICSSVASIRFVSWRVFVSGCFWMERMTASTAFAEPRPSGVPAPIRTSATSPISTGTPPRTVMTVAAMSSSPRTRPVPRMRYSCPPSMKTPPEAFTLEPSAARTTSSRVTP